jgi:hemerythrin-like domain-containing protein
LRENYVAGKIEALQGILDMLKVLVELYPKHIRKEDSGFFYPSMKYFSQEEQDQMLDDCNEFDKNFTSKRYRQIIKDLTY